MDSWSNEQVEFMKKNGNAASNSRLNPRNARPPIPLDVDEVNSAMERFLRQKYEYRSLQNPNASPTSTQHNTRSTSPEPQPPPLPPKPNASRFISGLRPSTSSYPSQRSPRLDQEHPPLPFEISRDGASKASRVFGSAGMATSAGGSLESKLSYLKDMGFKDDKRNSTVLKGLGGNLDQTIESLIRLGEGNAKVPQQNAVIPATATPNAANSNNPFDIHQKTDSTQGSALPRLAQPLQAANSTTSNNPFGIFPIQEQSQWPSAHPFQALQQPSQPLFPNMTGEYPNQQQQFVHTKAEPQHTYFDGLLSHSPPPINVTGNSNPFLTEHLTPPNIALYQNPQAQFANTYPVPQVAYYHDHFQAPTQPSDVPAANRPDKSSIMALYNFPQLAPTPPPLVGVQSAEQAPKESAIAAFAPSFQRSISSPTGPIVGGSRNPFLRTSRPPEPDGPDGGRLASSNGIFTGRHSDGMGKPQFAVNQIAKDAEATDL
ncbi:MAG: hypothetical protein M1829_004417 [Trizodia sp. TS-e1964]|nr:MAG: hypothetical protein M1829_004417 [Trizodia sp. TS-e1964]